MGELLNVETSLRGPCEPAPAPVSAVPTAGFLEASRSLISTGMWEGCCAVVDERGCEAWAWPAPDVSILLLVGGFLRVDARCWPGQVYREGMGIWASATVLQIAECRQAMNKQGPVIGDRKEMW